jgi:PAS domain S-box-containing protein
MASRKPAASDERPSNDTLAQENAALREALQEARDAQARLRDTEQRLRDVIEHAPVVLFATDRNGIFTLCEGRGLQALGRVPGQVVGMSAFEVYRDFPQILANMRECLAGKQINDLVRVRDLVFDTLYVPQRDSKNRVIGVSGVAWDVTARFRAEETLEAQLRQSQKMETIGTLAGGIAHDFNNILSPILGYADLAATDLPPGHPARNDIEQVIKAGHRARELVKQILIFSRRSDQVKRPVQLHLVVNEALKLIRSMLPSNIEVSQRVESQGDTVLADAGQMHQVITNLCMNAAHAMREKGGVLRVELVRRDIDESTAKAVNLEPGSFVVLSVIDQGEGMDPATRGRVFEPFFTTKRPGEGTGLGLSVVHGIVHSHGGGIEVASRPGEGSTFRVYFPPAMREEIAPRDAVVSDTGRGGEHILIVDDDPTNLQLLQRMLESRGFKVTAYASGEEALASFRARPETFDAIITDQTMPRMNGLELARAVHAHRSDVPVVLTTGYVDGAPDRDLGRDIAAVVAKPFDAGTVTGVLRKALDRA